MLQTAPDRESLHRNCVFRRARLALALEENLNGTLMGSDYVSSDEHGPCTSAKIDDRGTFLIAEEASQEPEAAHITLGEKVTSTESDSPEDAAFDQHASGLIPKNYSCPA